MGLYEGSHITPGAKHETRSCLDGSRGKRRRKTGNKKHGKGTRNQGKHNVLRENHVSETITA